MHPKDLLVISNKNLVAVWILEIFEGLLFDDLKMRLSGRLHRTLREKRHQRLETAQQNLILTFFGFSGGVILTRWQLAMNYVVPQDQNDMEQHVLRRVVESCFASNDQVDRVEIHSSEYKDLNLECLKESGRVLFGGTILMPMDRVLYRQ